MIAEYVIRCDYCGEYADFFNAVTSAIVDRQLEDGSKVVLPSVYCGSYCARQVATPFGSSRG